MWAATGTAWAYGSTSSASTAIPRHDRRLDITDAARDDFLTNSIGIDEDRLFLTRKGSWSQVPAPNQLVAFHVGELAANFATSLQARCPNGDIRRSGDTNCDGRVRVAILGDSYISGEGAADGVTQEPPNESTWFYELGTDSAANKCHRSRASWAYRVATPLTTQAGDGIAFIACSGAVTGDILHNAQFPDSPIGMYGGSKQIDALESFDLEGDERGNVDLIFLSVGGNDVGFADIISNCLTGFCQWNAANQYLGRPDGIRAALRQTYASIAEVAPQAEIWVPEYMNSVTGRVCGSTGLNAVMESLPGPLRLNLDKFLASVDRPEQLFLKNEFLPALNEAITDEARALGLRVFSTVNAFAGHEICEDPAYVNGVKAGSESNQLFIAAESFHPNAMGHRRLANIFTSSIVANGDFGTTPAYREVIPTPAVVPALPVIQGTGLGQMPPTGLLPPGTNITIQGSGALPSASLRVVLESVPMIVATPVADANGDFSATIALPSSLPPGFHTVTVDHLGSGHLVGSDLIAVDAAVGCAPDPSEADVDGDLRPDRCDPNLADGPDADADHDGVPNYQDRCPNAADPSQDDANSNGIGDACDPALGVDLFIGAPTVAPLYNPLSPARILDTRSGVGGPVAAVGPGGVRSLTVTGVGGVPSGGVGAVVLNVTVTQPSVGGFLTVYPFGESRPMASNLNFVAGQTVPNLVIAKVGSDGKVNLYNAAGNTHVIADVGGLVAGRLGVQPVVAGADSGYSVGGRGSGGCGWSRRGAESDRDRGGGCAVGRGWCGGAECDGDPAVGGWVLDGVSVWGESSVGVEPELRGGSDGAEPGDREGGCGREGVICTTRPAAPM